jgi:hypothetical protein
MINQDHGYFTPQIIVFVFGCTACLMALSGPAITDGAGPSRGECNGVFSRAKQRPSRINWTVRCTLGETPFTVWLYPARQSPETVWPFAFSRTIRDVNSGVKVGSCISGERRRPLACHIHRMDLGMSKGWVVVDRVSRCKDSLLMVRSIPEPTGRPSILFPRTEDLFRGLPIGCGVGHR